MAIFMAQLCGFIPEFVASMQQVQRVRLGFACTWALVSILVGATAVGHLTTFFSPSYYLAVAIGAFVGVMILAAQIYVVSSSGADCSLEDGALAEWAPHPARWVVFAFLGILLSQPVLIWVYQKLYTQEITREIQTKRTLHNEMLRSTYKRQEDALRLRQAALANVLAQQNGGAQASVVSHSSGQIAGSRRLALLIGNQSYPTAPLNNPSKDASDLEAKLISMGFQVTTVKNGTKADIEYTIGKYVESIHAGDISLFYFSGHGFQDYGQNYLVPVDFQPNDKSRSRAIGLNITIEAISARLPLISVAIIDACRAFSFGSSGGLAATEAGLNTYIALAAKPGQYAEDGKPGTNGIFTSGILKYIDQPIDIDSIFREVRHFVVSQTHGAQETWTSHNLTTEAFVLNGRVSSGSTAISYGNNPHLSASIYEGAPPLCKEMLSHASIAEKAHVFKICQNASLLMINDELESIANLSQDTKLDDKLVPMNTPPQLLDILSLLYDIKIHPVFFFAGSVGLTFLFVGPFVYRDRKSEFLRTYELLKHQANRTEISIAYYKHLYDINLLGLAQLSERFDETKSIFGLANGRSINRLGNNSILTSKDAQHALFTHLAGTNIGDVQCHS